MSSPGQTSSYRAGDRSAGPQGTRLFSTDALRQYASEVETAPDGPASKRKPVLQGLSAGLENLRFPLHQGRQTIGRRSDNDIIINDSSVSASHGWIIIQSAHYVIMNTLSTNGTYVNDRRIHEAQLKHGDHVRLGEAEFRFLTREQSGDPSGRQRWLAAGVVVTGIALLAWWLI